MQKDKIVQKLFGQTAILERHFASFATIGANPKSIILSNLLQFMGAFVISKRFNGDYKFIFASRRGKTIFTSIGCKHKSDCERMIDGIKNNVSAFGFTKVRNAGGKYMFRLSKDGLVLANSRKYSTELRLQKGIDEIVKYVNVSETLDFSENDFVFPDEENVFTETENSQII